MVREVAEKGFESLTVADIVERAGVSRATFYELFEDESECLFAAYDRVIDALVAHATRAFNRPGSWPVKMRRALGALLEAFAAEPEVAWMATVEVQAAGPDAQRSYRGALERFLPLFIEGRRYAQGNVLPADLERMAVGGVEGMIFNEVIAGRTEELPELLPDILFAVLVPYIGPQIAAAEVQRTGILSPR